MVAAFGDPGMPALKELADVPVIGITEAALCAAALQGHRFSIIAISDRIRPWYLDCVERFGLGGRLASIRSINESLNGIGSVQQDFKETLLALSRQAVAEDGADVVILAGAPLAGLARELAGQIPVPVVDGISAGIRMAQSVVASSPARTAPAPSRRHRSRPARDFRKTSMPPSRRRSTPPGCPHRPPPLILFPEGGQRCPAPQISSLPTAPWSTVSAARTPTSWCTAGRIVQLVDASEPVPAAARTIDAAGQLVIPGGVDGHCHVAQVTGRFRTLDDYRTTSTAALWGGTTTIIDFGIPRDARRPRWPRC